MRVILALVIGLLAVAEASALDRRVRIINDTSVDLYEFYASNVDADTWEEDILGNNILPAGNNVIINIDDGAGYCMFDFRAVFANGREAVDQRVNVCEIESFRYR